MIGHIEFMSQKLHRYNSFIDNDLWRVVEKVEFFIYNSCVRRILVFIYMYRRNAKSLHLLHRVYVSG